MSAKSDVQVEAPGRSSSLPFMPRQCQILRVFTREEDGGNHLGVVTDLTGLTPETMQAIATDLGFSETIFCDLRARSPQPESSPLPPKCLSPVTRWSGWLGLNEAPRPGRRIRCQVGEIRVSFEGLQTWIEGHGEPAGGDHRRPAARR